MATYLISFDGIEGFLRKVEHSSIEEARNDAVATLGVYLQEHPRFAYERHWRVDLQDQSGRLLLHVIVATVEAAKPLNWASFDGEETLPSASSGRVANGMHHRPAGRDGGERGLRSAAAVSTSPAPSGDD